MLAGAAYGLVQVSKQHRIAGCSEVGIASVQLAISPPFVKRIAAALRI